MSRSVFQRKPRSRSHVFAAEAVEVLNSQDVALAPLITVVGPSGGVGRSSISLGLAALTAASGIDTVLVEADLQFGDYATWFGLGDALPNVTDWPANPLLPLGQGIDLVKAPAFPEQSDMAAEALIEALPALRSGKGLAIADTSANWSAATASLLAASDIILMVVDGRPASLANAVRAAELCARMGIPSSRMVAVCNRYGGKSRATVAEVQLLLDVNTACAIPDGKAAFEVLMGSGELEELVSSGNAAVRGLKELLAEVLPKVGYLYADAPLPQHGSMFR